MSPYRENCHPSAHDCPCAPHECICFDPPEVGYRTNAKPPEPLPKKKPFLCRIGLHFWGGWALDGCGVFWCTRCDKHFITHNKAA